MKLPIGLQCIRKILSKKNYLYVDKTHFIKRLIDGDEDHYFITRPRRFGKSLFLSTLAEVFRGSRDLFEGFYIYDSDYSWQEHPVLYFDFSLISAENFEINLKENIIHKAKSYNIKTEGSSLQLHLTSLINRAACGS